MMVLFADDTSLFSVIHDTQTSANDLKKDFETSIQTVLSKLKKSLLVEKQKKHIILR